MNLRSVQRNVPFLATVFPDLVRSAGAAAGLESGRVISDIDGDLILLRTDGEKTMRILTNLLENANRHSPPDASPPISIRNARRAGSRQERAGRAKRGATGS